MIQKKPFWLIALLFSTLLLLAFDPPGSYRYPLDKQYILAGTFAELRSNHFHSGIDIKTGGEIGLPVYAVRDGFLYRIKTNPYGYGRALYLRHHDGTFSVYAHLSGFRTDIDSFVYSKQEASQRYSQELYPEQSMFRFKEGDFIGYSGNSGSSTAPHLHFEIRDSMERPLNALLPFRHLVKDDQAPVLERIAFEPIDATTRINGRFDKLLLTPNGRRGALKLTQPIEVEGGRVGLEYQAYDQLNAAHNKCGINSARLFLDDSLIFELDLDRFSFDESNLLNVHIDFAYFQKKKKRLEKAYIDQGNELPFYKHVKERGMIHLQDSLPHAFRLELTDIYDNLTQVEGVLIRKEIEPFASFRPGKGNASIRYEVKRNILKVIARNPAPALQGGLLSSHALGQRQRLLPDYGVGNEMVYLLPLEEANYPIELADSSGVLSIQPDFVKEISPDRNNLVSKGDIKLYFPFQSAFFPFHLSLKESPPTAGCLSDIYEAGDRGIPLKKPFWVSFETGDMAEAQEHMVIAVWGKKEWKFLGNERNAEGDLFAKSRSFGRFCVRLDSLPPILKPLNFRDGGTFKQKPKTLRLRATDAFAGINDRSIEAYLDGKWILFEFDFQKEVILHRFREYPKAGSHSLSIRIADGAGNYTKKTYTLNF